SRPLANIVEAPIIAVEEKVRKIAVARRVAHPNLRVAHPLVAHVAGLRAIPAQHALHQKGSPLPQRRGVSRAGAQNEAVELANIRVDEDRELKLRRAVFAAKKQI